jgi:hypothetical protein
MATFAEFQRVLKGQMQKGTAGFSEYWSAEKIEAACREQKHQWRDRTWTPLKTIWTFLLQVLHPGSSCREAVALALGEQAATSGKESSLPSADPGAYCQARGRLPGAVLLDGVQHIGQRLQEEVGAARTWLGRRVRLVDATTCSMSDTANLQKAFGQPTRQKPGCGFPVAKVVALFCWASGAVLAAAIGPYAMSELHLWRELGRWLSPGEIVLGDCFYCSFYDLVLLVRCGCDGVFRLHQKRPKDFRQGKRLGPHERLVTWERPKRANRPRGMSRKEWKRLPETLTVRLIRARVGVPGFRSRTVYIATTLLDPAAYPAAEIVALYRDRWLIELRFRDIKITLGMDVLRGKSEDIVKKEIYMHLLAYNLTRCLMWQAAARHGRPLHRLSFAGTVSRLNAMAPFLSACQATPHAQRLYEILLKWIARDPVPDRPNRIEPRALKRRPKEYALLNRPRNQMRKALLHK